MHAGVENECGMVIIQPTPRPHAHILFLKASYSIYYRRLIHPVQEVIDPPWSHEPNKL